jgi:hypothetical protein
MKACEVQLAVFPIDKALGLDPFGGASGAMNHPIEFHKSKAHAPNIIRW